MINALSLFLNLLVGSVISASQNYCADSVYRYPHLSCFKMFIAYDNIDQEQSHSISFLSLVYMCVFFWRKAVYILKALSIWRTQGHLGDL